MMKELPKFCPHCYDTDDGGGHPKPVPLMRSSKIPVLYCPGTDDGCCCDFVYDIDRGEQFVYVDRSWLALWLWVPVALLTLFTVNNCQRRVYKSDLLKKYEVRYLFYGLVPHPRL